MSYNYYNVLSLQSNENVLIWADSVSAQINVRWLHIQISIHGSSVYRNSPNISESDSLDYDSQYHYDTMFGYVENFYFRKQYLHADPDGFVLTKKESDFLCDHIEDLVNRFLAEKESDMVRNWLVNHNIDVVSIESDPLLHTSVSTTEPANLVDLLAIQFYARSLI